MKITDIKALRLNLQTDEWDLIILETDSGARGWGDVTGSLDFMGVVACVEGFKEHVIGNDPDDIVNILFKIKRWEYPSKLGMRSYCTALSGLDQALWDLRAKKHGVPLHVLYGNASVSSIPLYANLNKALRKNRDPELMGEHAKLARLEGYEMIKCTPFDEINPSKPYFDISLSLERIRKVLDNVPVNNTAIDCHQRFTRDGLAKMLKIILDGYGIPFWVEDTVPIDDYQAQRIVVERFPEIRFAAGEDALNFPKIREIIDSGLYDVIMPDVKYIGGPSVVKTVVAVCNDCLKPVSLHNPNGLIATAHSAHLSSISMTGMPMEYPFMAVENRASLANPTENIVEGRYVFNDSPGIGVEIREEVLKEYGRIFNLGEWKKYSKE